MCNKIMFKDYNNVRDIIKPNFIHLTALPSVAIKLKASRYATAEARAEQTAKLIG